MLSVDTSMQNGFGIFWEVINVEMSTSFGKPTAQFNIHTTVWTEKDQRNEEW